MVVSLGSGRPANSASKTPPSAAETMQWAHGYSGCIGVSMNGVQPGSATLASLPSWPPLRIAVIGRQKLYAYFASNTAINASSMAIPTAASRRAFWLASRPGAAVADRATGQ